MAGCKIIPAALFFFLLLAWGVLKAPEARGQEKYFY
jgi:hypothetical protein